MVEAQRSAACKLRRQGIRTQKPILKCYARHAYILHLQALQPPRSRFTPGGCSACGPPARMFSTMPGYLASAEESLRSPNPETPKHNNSNNKNSNNSNTSIRNKSRSANNTSTDNIRNFNMSNYTSSAASPAAWNHPIQSSSHPVGCVVATAATALRTSHGRLSRLWSLFGSLI